MPEAIPTGQLSPEDLRDLAELHDGAGPVDGGEYVKLGPAAGYDWRYEPELPLDQVCGTRQEWREFARDERPDRAWMDAYWKHPLPDDPIVVSLESGVYRIWDGAHRTALSHERGDLTIPAIIGTRKESDA